MEVSKLSDGMLALVAHFNAANCTENDEAAMKEVATELHRRGLLSKPEYCVSRIRYPRGLVEELLELVDPCTAPGNLWLKLRKMNEKLDSNGRCRYPVGKEPLANFLLADPDAV